MVNQEQSSERVAVRWQDMAKVSEVAGRGAMILWIVLCLLLDTLMAHQPGRPGCSYAPGACK